MAKEKDIEAIKRRSVFGVIALTSRTFVLQIITFTATFILTVLLDPSVFGIFFVVSAVIAFLNYFSDIGLAAALIQQKEKPTRKDLVTTFTIQQLLVGSAVFISLLFSKQIGNFYGLSTDGIWLFRSLVISFFLSSLKTIPSVLLERKLDFNRLVIPQIFETSIFYTVAVILAWYGFGISSFSYASVLRGISGLIAIYILAPWIPGIGIAKLSAKKLLTFGMPFQANSFIALVKDDLVTIVLGKFLPFSQIGYIGWAKKWAEVPLRLIMDSIIRVTFPAYSRLQEHKEVLSRAIEKSIFFLSLLILPLSAGLMLFINPLISLIPRYGKWEPAVLSFYLFTISAVLAGLSSPLVNALNAIGKVTWTLKLMVFWTVLTWTLVPAGVFLFGFNGVSAAAAAIACTSFLPIFILRKFVSFSVFSHIYKAFAATIVMATVMFVSLQFGNKSIPHLTTTAVFGFFVYTALIWFLAKDDILSTVRKYLHAPR